MSSLSQLLSNPSYSPEYHSMSSSSSSSTSSSSDESSSSMSKRLRGATPSFAPLLPFCLSGRALPNALTVHVLNYLPFEKLMYIKRSSRFINSIIAGFVVTDYRLTYSREKFTNEIFKQCLLGTNVSRVTIMDLSNTPVSDFGIIANCRLPALKALKLSSAFTTISKEQMAAFSTHNPQVEKISLQKSTEVDVLSSLNFHQLLELDLESERGTISIEEVRLLSEAHPHLQRLSLKNLCGENILPHLKFPKLRELNLETSEMLEDLENVERHEDVAVLSANCPQLTSLNMCNGRGDFSLFDLSKLNFPLMEHLDISWWLIPENDPDFLSKGFSSLFKKSPHLHSLNVGHLYGIGKDASLLNLLPQLTTLNIAGSTLDDECFTALSASCSSRLTSLDLDEAENLSVEKFALVKFPELTHLNFSTCYQVSDKWMAHLSTNYPKLKILNLRDINITRLGLADIILPELTDLDISNRGDDQNFNEEDISLLKKNCPKLKNLLHGKLQKFNRVYPSGLTSIFITPPCYPFIQEIFNGPLSKNW